MSSSASQASVVTTADGVTSRTTSRRSRAPGSPRFPGGAMRTSSVVVLASTTRTSVRLNVTVAVALSWADAAADAASTAHAVSMVSRWWYRMICELGNERGTRRTRAGSPFPGYRPSPCLDDGATAVAADTNARHLPSGARPESTGRLAAAQEPRWSRPRSPSTHAGRRCSRRWRP